jgi:hypothetical protein
MRLSTFRSLQELTIRGSIDLPVSSKTVAVRKTLNDEHKVLQLGNRQVVRSRLMAGAQFLLLRTVIGDAFGRSHNQVVGYFGALTANRPV